MPDTPTHEALRDSANQAIDAYFDRFTTATGQLFGPIDAEMRALRHFAALAAADAALSVQAEPVAHLWQHTETGRTRIVTPDMIITADATWVVVGPLYLGTPQPPAPVPAVPLTPEELADKCEAWLQGPDSFMCNNPVDAYESGFRAAEAHHNITGAPDHG